MAWLAVDRNGCETIFSYRPCKCSDVWSDALDYVEIPNGSIRKLIGKDLTWDDEPVELT